MNDPIKILSAEQAALVADLVESYGIEPEEVMFFTDEKKPFLTYEATSQLCNILTDLANISVEPVTSPVGDSIAVKCTIRSGSSGRERSAVGVANFGEFKTDAEIPSQQTINLASSRALRNVLKASGIDLIRLHREATSGEVLDPKLKSNFVSLLGQAHAVGIEKNLIAGPNKTLWYHELWSRYRASHSNELSETQLADFVAYLNAYQPPTMAQATA